MAKLNGTPKNSVATWTGTQAYSLAVICLLVGVAVGYFVRGSAAPQTQTGVSETAAAPSAMGDATGQAAPSPDQMKHMADKQAEQMLTQLKADPNNADLLARIGNVYYDAGTSCPSTQPCPQLFQESINYYERSLKVDPKNPNVRTDMGTAYYYMGDADRAINEFQTALQYDPKHGQTMFNLGMVKWQGKGDVNGAVQSWETLLKVVPNYPERAKVEQLISKAKQHTNMAPGTKTSKPATM